MEGSFCIQYVEGKSGLNTVNSFLFWHIRDFTMLKYNPTLQERDIVYRVLQMYLNHVNPILREHLERLASHRMHLRKPWTMEFAARYFTKSRITLNLCIIAEITTIYQFIYRIDFYYLVMDWITPPSKFVYWSLIPNAIVFGDRDIKKLLLFSHLVVSDSFMMLWTVVHRAPLTMGFPRQEYRSGLPFPSPEDLPDPGTEPVSPALQEDSLRLNELIKRATYLMGLMSLWKGEEIPEIPFSFQRPREDTARAQLSTSWEVMSQQKPTLLQLVDELLVSRTVGNKFFLFKSPSLWYFITATLAD